MKTVIVMKLSDLINVNATFTPQGHRALNGLLVSLKSPSFSLHLECLQFTENGVEYVKYEHIARTGDLSFVENVCEKLTLLNIDHTKNIEHGAVIRVNVLDLLDTHWMIYQLIGEPTLKIQTIDGTAHYLQFMNDGMNLIAQFDGTLIHNYADCAALMNNLKFMSTKFEVIV